MIRNAKPVITAVFVLFASAAHATTCVPAQGVVTLTPDPACRIVAAVAAWQGSEPPDPAMLAQFPGADPAAVCFVATGSGTVQFSGFFGLTAVPVVNALGDTSATPLGYPIPGSARAGLTSFTAQGVLSGRMRQGGVNKTGTLFTKDTGVFGTDGKAAEIIKIVGGTGDFQGASGTIAVAGQELGGYAVFTGAICTPN